MTIARPSVLSQSTDSDESPAIEPLFIFSIARSGSTLLQRVLGSYDEIATVPEPWLLIPLLYTTRRTGVVSEYTHPLAVDAIDDFAGNLDGGREAYLEELRELALRLYRRAATPGARYFLDKTPPYFLIIDDVLRMFPQSKAILLWRNPLSVAASLANYSGQPWNPVAYKQNFFDGIANLTAAQRKHADRLHVVRYEELIEGGEDPWRRLAAHLELEFDPDSLSRFSEVALDGRMGDPHGRRRYGELSREPLTKWRNDLNTPIRKAWCERWLRWIGAERLELMGYDLERLLADLAATPTDWRRMPEDARQLATALVKEPYRVRARRSLALGGTSPLRYLL